MTPISFRNLKYADPCIVMGNAQRRVLWVVCIPLLIVASACTNERATTVRDVLAHQDAFADSSIELRGRLTAPVAAPLLGSIVARYLVDRSANGAQDSILVLIPVPSDTFPIARDIRLHGRVRGVSAFGGLLRVGPVLMVEAPEHAAGAGQGARP